MRWFLTFVLLLLAAAAGLWLWAGNALAPKLGLNVAPADEPPSEARKVLALVQSADAFAKLEVAPAGGSPFTLTRAADGTWTQPGNWPVRQDEAKELAAAVAGLTTRFRPVALTGDAADLKRYGLDPTQQPTVVKADIAGRTLTLAVGQPPAEPGTPPTARPTYLRVDTIPEVLRVPPDVVAALSAGADKFRGKRLFPDADRVKVTGGDPPFNPMTPTPPAGAKSAPLAGDQYTSVRADGPDGGYALKRVTKTPAAKAADGGIEPTLAAAQLATAWEIAETAAAGEKREFKPLRDKPDPARLRGVLAAVPDLWADRFVSNKTAAETGLDKPERTLTVTKANGQTVTLRFGKVSDVKTKVTPPPQSQFGAPPQPPTITTEEFRYAKLDGNDIVFEMRADKLADLFVKPDDLRDATVARFDTADVSELTVAPAGKPAVKLVKKKGNKDAEREDDKQDRWLVGDILAEATKVTEVLDALGKLEARGPDVADAPDAKTLTEKGIDPAAGTKLTVVVQEKGEPAPPPRTLTFLLGKADAEKKKLPVQLAGWPEVVTVNDDLTKLIERPALAYRGRRLFDTADAKLTTVAVTRAADPYTVAQANDKWTITAPVATPADEAKASQLAGELSRLEVIEYVDDTPKPEDLDKKYGLAKPQMTVALTFTGPGAKPATLEIGNAPEFVAEHYARLAGGSVFKVNKSVVDSIRNGPLSLLPLDQWTTTADKITGVVVKRAAESYTLSPDGTDWKLTGPFEAKVPAATAAPLLAAVGTVKAEKYESLSAADAAKFGFDKPALTLTVSYKDGDKPASKTLVVGKLTADAATTRFAKLEGGPTQAVFAVPEKLVTDADKPALDLLDKSLLTLDPAAVTKVAFAGTDPVTLSKDAAGWKAEGQPFAVDRPTAEAAVNAVARPTVKKLAGFGPAVKWADFGLEPPAATITATTDKPHTLKLGKPSPDGGRYARIDDGPAVAVLDGTSAADLTRGKLDFIDRTLLTLDPSSLTAVVRRTADDTELSLTGTPAGGWKIDGKDVGNALRGVPADAPLMDDLSDALSRLRATKVAAFAPPSLAKFGLAEPTAALILTADKPATLLLGDPVDPANPDGDRYALVEGQTTVGVLAGSLAKKLLAAPLKFRDRSLAKFVDADRATLVRGDRTATFAKINGTWKLVKPVEAEAEQLDLDELVNALAKLRADEWEADSPASLTPFGLDKPTATWTLAQGESAVLTLLVGTAKDGRAFAKTSASPLVAVLDVPTTAKVLGEYRKRSVWSGVDAAQVESIAVQTAGGGFALNKLGSTWVDRDKPADAIEAAKVSEFLDALAGLKAERFAADKDADRQLFGLSPPQRVIVLTQRGGVVKSLQIGRAEGGSGDKRVYARVEEANRSDVFVLSEADTAKLTRDRAGFVGKK